jgi:hypothetical protein
MNIWTTFLEYATPILTAIGFGSGWLIGKYTYTGLVSTVNTEIATIKTELAAVKAKLP